MAQTNNDPYNPLTRRTGTQAVEPTLTDYGYGTDEGNVGPFVSLTDKQYAQAMAIRGMMEVQLGNAAMEKASRPEVKAIARRMVSDYLQWNAGMEKAALKLGIPLQRDLDAKHKAEVDKICALSGAAFEEAYLKEVIHLQTKALTMSHQEASEASVSGFRHFAGIVTPQLVDQVQKAQKALAANRTEISRR